MDISLPSDEEAEEQDPDFPKRVDLYESYWLYVDCVRYVGPILRQSEATREDEDRSPLARHYNHFYKKKEAYKEKCRELPKGLPTYKKRFEAPRGDVEEVPLAQLDRLGISWSEGDDPIWIPSEYELPSVWENGLQEMDEEELRETVRDLRFENRQLRDERNELRKQLAKVSDSLSNYLDSVSSSEPQHTDEESSSPKVCGKCGEQFDSEAAKNGHRSHCTDSGQNQRGSKGRPQSKELEQLAAELPELNEKQAVENHEVKSSEEELENLNHLLQGNI